MENTIHLIETAALLKAVPADEIQVYLKSGKFRTVSYKKGSILHTEGDKCSCLEMILCGGVAIDRIDESGDYMTVGEFFSDDIIGGNILFSKNPYYPLTITAKQDTIMLEIGRDLLFDLLGRHPAVLRSFLGFVSDHASVLGEKIKHYVNRTIRDSVIVYLKNESKKQNSNVIRLDISKKALAEKIGVQRTSLSRELAKMKRDGLILYNGKRIELLDPIRS